jgi:hypothetical protein
MAQLDSHSEFLKSLSLDLDPIWNDIPKEMQLPIQISSSLLWKCPCPLPCSSSVCLFEIYLRNPSDLVRTWLSEEDLAYISPPDGEPKWDKYSPKLHNILFKAICHHYAYDHLEKAGIYIREVCTRIYNKISSEKCAGCFNKDTSNHVLIPVAVYINYFVWLQAINRLLMNAFSYARRLCKEIINGNNFLVCLLTEALCWQ